MEARAYKNLNNGKWSIKQRVEGKWQVVGHCDALALNNVTAVVSDKRHDAVRAAKCREVFAFLQGELCWAKGFVPFKGREVTTVDAFPLRPFNRTESITFHPFADVKQGFIWRDDASPFVGASCAYFTDNSGVWAL